MKNTEKHIIYITEKPGKIANPKAKEEIGSSNPSEINQLVLNLTSNKEHEMEVNLLYELINQKLIELITRKSEENTSNKLSLDPGQALNPDMETLEKKLSNIGNDLQALISKDLETLINFFAYKLCEDLNLQANKEDPQINYAKAISSICEKHPALNFIYSSKNKKDLYSFLLELKKIPQNIRKMINTIKDKIRSLWKSKQKYEIYEHINIPRSDGSISEGIIIAYNKDRNKYLVLEQDEKISKWVSEKKLDDVNR